MARVWTICQSWCGTVWEFSVWSLDHKSNALAVTPPLTPCCLDAAVHRTHTVSACYHLMCMRSMDYAVARCSSVCHTPVLCGNSKTCNQTFSLSGGHYSSLWQYSTGDPPSGALNTGGVWKKSQFSAVVLYYLRNDTRYAHSYCEMQIRNHMQAFECYHLQWPWVTSSGLAKYSVTRSIVQPLCNSWASCLMTFESPVLERFWGVLTLLLWTGHSGNMLKYL